MKEKQQKFLKEIDFCGWVLYHCGNGAMRFSCVASATHFFIVEKD
jgi:hypothetical protein